MGIDRERKPRHQGFHRRDKPVRTRPVATSGRRADVRIMPKTGPVRIFLDDEREMPEGFVVARTVEEFRQLLDEVDPARLRTVCLDWHLGEGPTGFDAVEALIARLGKEPEAFVDLRSIWMHSQIIEKAAQMSRILARWLHAPERKEFFDETHVIVDPYTPSFDL